MGGKVASAKKVQWMWQVARMKAFDNLILNTDRNAQNMLIDDDWHIILIDHSRAFVSSKNLLPQKHELPNTFNRGMVAKMQQMSIENMTTLMDGVLDKNEVKALIARRDKLMKHYDKVGEEERRRGGAVRNGADRGLALASRSARLHSIGPDPGHHGVEARVAAEGLPSRTEGQSPRLYETWPASG